MVDAVAGEAVRALRGARRAGRWLGGEVLVMVLRHARGMKQPP